MNTKALTKCPENVRLETEEIEKKQEAEIDEPKEEWDEEQQ